ncbi:hypothetical protein Lal_00010316 [Lupinus albus]|nr:hypothetical protein Lal_00010316 [Lupinus albus]
MSMIMFPSIYLSTNITVISTLRTTKTHNHNTTTPPLSNTINLNSLCKSGKLDEALHLIQSNSEQDINGFSLFLNACISTKSIHHAQKLCSHLRKTQKDSILENPNLKSKLITLYSVCGKVDEARRVFETSDKRPESVYVAMAIGYSRNGFSKEALLLYCDMLSQYIEPENFAFSMALKACTDLSNALVGRAIHAQITKHRREADQVVNNALLKFYVDCGCFDEVLKVFEVMPQRNVVSWNTLIAGYAALGRVSETLDSFRIMQREEGTGFSWVTLTTVLPICAQLTTLLSGKEMHGQIVKSRKKPDVPLLNSLMDMYAKCGAISYCEKVFDRMHSKDLTSWNTMLGGYSVNGRIEEAIALFEEMIRFGIRPDGISFVALLSGCSHSGLTNEGKRLFDMMQDYGVQPSLEHYACLVDLLGRSGKLAEAYATAENIPMKPSGSIWGSLLNSCRLHCNVSLAETVAERLFDIEPNNPGNYVMLSNIYANARMWDGVNRVREMMAMKGIKKDAGCSWIQMKHKIHTFVAGGSSDFRCSAEYSKVWTELSNAIEDEGYIPDTSVVLHDINEEMKTMWVCGHSERIAAVFALIHTSPGMPIRITNNLRVCVDCHSWMKAVSRVTRRPIVLRDTNRFHHFEHGTCSCKDYW